MKPIELNIPKLVKAIKSDRKNLMIWLGISAVVGVIVAFSIPKEYEAGVTLAPESSTANSLTNSISSLASMVGMDMSFGGGQDAIYPEIYPDLVQSTDFIVSLFPVRVKSLDGEIDTDYYDYLKTKQKTEWWFIPVNYAKDIIKKFKSDDHRGNGKGNEVDPFMLTRDQFMIVKGIMGSVTCEVDKKTSVISLSVKAQDPLIAATLCDSIKERLQVYIINYRTNKARNDLAYMERLCEDARLDYVKAQTAYAKYADAHKNLILTAYVTKQEELENELQLKYGIYQQVVQQLQLAKAKVQEKTPAFTVVRTITVPVKHCNKPKILILILFLILGGMARTATLCWKKRNDIFDGLEQFSFSEQ